MLSNTTRYQPTGRCPQPTPDPAREDLLNQRCTSREDPRFAEWRRLTSALGLDSLTLGQLAAFHADAADAIFPGIGARGEAASSDFAGHPVGVPAPFGIDRREGAGDTVLGDRVATIWRANGVPAAGVGIPEAFVAMDDGVFDGRLGGSSAHDGRGK